MILIISQNEYEDSSNRIIDWLDRFSATYRRINGNELFENISYKLYENQWALNSNCMDTLPDPKDVNVIWNRRWVSRGYLAQNASVFTDIGLNMESRQYVMNEYKTLRSLFCHYYRRGKWIDLDTNISVNKLKVLEIASGLGLKIPETCITNQKSELRAFLKTSGQAIVKSIAQVSGFKLEGKIYNMYTKPITIESLNIIPDSFFPSCFQKCIEKKFEIRVVYFFGKIYSMAIFSQESDLTKYDFRVEFDLDFTLRKSPYKMPETISAKIQHLMQQLGLTSGSLDFIYSKDNEYIFLEVNPIGQFGMTSIPCNYGIEREIAKKLIEFDTN
ncbi:grasp-with-spasm system ATP-grasp peptide maturase [Olivibacter sp. CPCC 100613]|uniref:grasp-with-spasm system ATP-grasp peptide maturase n=1 Tax=Olivibacter sp. CPCC 100613 TaxID=3079931 RepID=UPI002FF6E892